MNSGRRNAAGSMYGHQEGIQRDLVIAEGRLLLAAAPVRELHSQAMLLL